MDLSEKVKRYAEIKAEISELKSEADGIEADILKASEADLEDTKFKSAVYSDVKGNTITVINADSWRSTNIYEFYAVHFRVHRQSVGGRKAEESGKA